MKMIINSIIIWVTLVYTLRAQGNCFLVSSTQSGFSFFRPSDSLQLGTINIQSPLPVTKMTSVDLPYSIELADQTPEVSVSPIYIENYVINETRGPDFQVTRVINPSNFSIIVLIDETSIWTAVTVHYIVSVLDNLRVGMFVASNPELLQPGENKQVTLSHQLAPNWAYPNIPKQASIFLSGLKTEDIKLYLQIIEPTIFISDSGQISVKLMIKEQSKPIEILQMAFIIYSNIQTSVGVSAVITSVPTVRDSLNGTNSTSEKYFINFFGMTDYNGSAVEVLVEGNRLLLSNADVINSVGSSYSNPAVIQTFLKGFNVEGLSFANVAGIDSIMTGDNQLLQNPLLCVTDQQCTKRQGIKYFDPTTKKKYCKICPQNTTYSFSEGDCICTGEFHPKDNLCISKNDLCELGFFFIDEKCIQYTFRGKPVCGSHQIFNTELGKCECEQNYVKKIDSDNFYRCFYICKQNNQTVNPETGQCECRAGNLDSKGICIECDSVSEVWNKDTKKCECDEANRYYLIKGECTRCALHSTYVQEEQMCVCETLYSGNGLTVCRRIRV